MKDTNARFVTEKANTQESLPEDTVMTYWDTEGFERADGHSDSNFILHFLSC